MGHLDPQWNEAKAPWPPGQSFRFVDTPTGVRWQLRPGAFLHEAAPALYRRWWRSLTGNRTGDRVGHNTLLN